MNFLERRKWKAILKRTDFQFAAAALIEEFQGGVIEKQLAALFDSYLENPCLETAVDIIKYNPGFVVYFKECHPTGVVYMKYQVIRKNRADQ